MSYQTLTYPNNIDIFVNSLTCNSIDADAPDGSRRLNIGFDSAESVHIGTNNPTNTPVYIDEVLFNPNHAAGYSALAPVTAIDGNGIIINNAVNPATLKLELATATQPGIVPTLGYTTQTGTIFVQDVVQFTGNLQAQLLGESVIIHISNLNHQMTNGGQFILNIALPVEYRPASARNFVCQGRNNSNWQFCSGQVGNDGIIKIGTSMDNVGVLIDFAMGDNNLFDTNFSYLL